MITDRRSALLLAPQAPYPLAGGGALRTASVLEYLARRYSVDAVVFREPGTPSPGDALPPALLRDLHIIDLPFHSGSMPARALRNLRRWMAGRAPLNDRFSGFAGPLERALEGRRYDLAVIEHFWCAPYWTQIAPHAARTVLDLHNIESALYDGYARAQNWPAPLLFRRFARAALELEREWLPKFASVLACSERDRARVLAIAPQTHAAVYPNAIPAVPQPCAAEEHAVVFSGSLAYWPNISAVRWFRRRVWPLLRDRWPKLVWRIVGRNPEAVARYTAGDPRIELSGPVQDAVTALAAAQVVVVPLLTGSGTRFKILEAWAAERPVVSTVPGAEGLPCRDGEHLVLAGGPREFAAAVSALLASPDQRLRIGRAGRALYEREFTWEHAWTILATMGI